MVSSKSEVLKALESFPVDLILLDVMFGIDDGREFCKAIKAFNKTVKIILLSANAELLKNHIECEADAVVEKPFSLKDLYAIIKHIPEILP